MWSYLASSELIFVRILGASYGRATQFWALEQWICGSSPYLCDKAIGKAQSSAHFYLGLEPIKVYEISELD